MRVSILCSNPEHPINEYLIPWLEQLSSSYSVDLARKTSELVGGDILFLVSCTEIVSAEIRLAFGVCLVLHASDLPRGRGWSPHIWEILNGATSVTLSAVEAEDKVDSGRIWAKKTIDIADTLLWSDINHILFTSELEMMLSILINYNQIVPHRQSELIEPTYHRRRLPCDSAIDPNKSIVAQFDLMRVCDPHRFPAYFDHRGQRYVLKIEKCK